MATGGAISNERQCWLQKGIFLQLSESHHKNFGLIGPSSLKLLNGKQFQDGDWWHHLG
jgi:hypothetical protein